MEKLEIKKLDEVIYKEVLSNGLTVYIYNKPGFISNYAFLDTKYGSVNNDFIPVGGKEKRNYPLGIAHFLEHKLFESSENESVFEKLENYGAYVNAATSYDKTYYYISTSNNFKECLKILIDFVYSPCFTDENVNKEKGIIGQEIDMCNDNPDRFMYQTLTYNVLDKSYYKYDIAGTKEDIDKITKEDLYECYNTFYNPSNMSLTIAGDFDVEDMLTYIKNCQLVDEKTNKIKQSRIKESDEVPVKYEKHNHNVKVNKVGYCYKINYNNIDKKELFILKKYLNIFYSILFDGTSGFHKYLVNNNLIHSRFECDYDILFNDNLTLLLYFIADAKDKEKFKKVLEDKILNTKDIKTEFEKRKKNILARFILSFESLEGVVSSIRSNFHNYDDEIMIDAYHILKSLNYEDFMKFIKSINLDNYTELELVGGKNA